MQIQKTQIRVKPYFAFAIKWIIVSLFMVSTSTFETIRESSKWPLMAISLLAAVFLVTRSLYYAVGVNDGVLSYKSLLGGGFFLELSAISSVRLVQEMGNPVTAFRHEIVVTVHNWRRVFHKHEAVFDGGRQ